MNVRDGFRCDALLSCDRRECRRIRSAPHLALCEQFDLHKNLPSRIAFSTIQEYNDIGIYSKTLYLVEQAISLSTGSMFIK